MKEKGDVQVMEVVDIFDGPCERSSIMMPPYASAYKLHRKMLDIRNRHKSSISLQISLQQTRWKVLEKRHEGLAGEGVI